MRIVLSNREWPFLRLQHSGRIPTITIIVRYMISMFQSDDVTVSDERSSFDLKYEDDDNVNRHLKKMTAS